MVYEPYPWYLERGVVVAAGTLGAAIDDRGSPTDEAPVLIVPVREPPLLVV